MSLPDEARSAQTYCPDARALADTELLLNGAFAPLTGFLGADDAHAVRASGHLTDGSGWPVPITLDVPEDVASKVDDGDPLTLTDAEGAPIANLLVRQRWESGDLTHLAGTLRPLQPVAAGVFRDLHRTPDQVRRDLADESTVLACLVDRPLHHDSIAAIRTAAAGSGAHVLLLAPTTTDRALPPESVVRLALAARVELGDATVVALRLAGRDDPADDARLLAHVAANYGATALLTHDPADAGRTGDTPIPVVPAPQVGYDEDEARWLPAAEIPAATRRSGLTAAQVDDLLAAGDHLPAWFTPASVAAELRQVRPPLTERGCTVLLTGLSGAGKSTVARALTDALAERADRTVTLLDGDVVRRMLSAGLGFSRADRDRNVLRIGYVAAEVCRHGGLAICAPIAPYHSTRAEVRRMVEEAGGGFVLVHVAASLEVCESRDRKGLYAKARAGLIDEFTGVSDPYEEPTDADLTLDTGVLPVPDSVRQILDHLTANGWLARTTTSGHRPGEDQRAR